MKILKTGTTFLIAVSLIFGLVGCTPPEKPVKIYTPKYKVLIGEYWGGYKAYYCNDFKVINGTYYLYDRQGKIIASLTAGKTHTVRAELNR